jgi:hypothetical protein
MPQNKIDIHHLSSVPELADLQFAIGPIKKPPEPCSDAGEVTSLTNTESQPESIGEIDRPLPL